jgi:hypothetical protein
MQEEQRVSENVQQTELKIATSGPPGSLKSFRIRKITEPNVARHILNAVELSADGLPVVLIGTVPGTTLQENLERLYDGDKECGAVFEGWTRGEIEAGGLKVLILDRESMKRPEKEPWWRLEEVSVPISVISSIDGAYFTKAALAAA